MLELSLWYYKCSIIFTLNSFLSFSSIILRLYGFTVLLGLFFSKSLEAFIENGDQVVEKGKLLLAETSKIIEE